MKTLVAACLPLVCAVAVATAESPPSSGERTHDGKSSWQLADLADAMQNLHGRSYERGRALFERRHCVVCHPADDVAKEFGPDLTKLDPRFQPLDILRDILDPSRRIADARYDLWTFETDWGREIAGLIKSETNAAVTVMEQPRSKAPPVVIKSSEIVSRKMSLMSIMPQGMLDGLTRDEVADLVAYVAARGDPQAEYVRPTPPRTQDRLADDESARTNVRMQQHRRTTPDGSRHRRSGRNDVPRSSS